MTQPELAPPTVHILIIDNYDSFTYNLVQYFGEQGCELTVWRNDAFTLAEVEKLNPDAIVVSPGPCTPLEAGLSVDVIRAFAPRYPLLGVCLGHQSIGEAFGATRQTRADSGTRQDQPTSRTTASTCLRASRARRA